MMGARQTTKYWKLSARCWMWVARYVPGLTGVGRKILDVGRKMHARQQNTGGWLHVRPQDAC